MYDASGQLLIRGIPGTGHKATVSNIVATSGGGYVARVWGAPDVTAVDYSLVMTRNGDFDTEPNDGTAPVAQDITVPGVVLGAVRPEGMGRLFVYDADANIVNEIDPLTGATLNAFASPVGEGRREEFGLATTRTTVLAGGSANEDIYELDPDNGSTLRTLPNPGVEVSGIAYLYDEVFLLTDTAEGRITVLDYATGAVRRTITTMPDPIDGGIGASIDTLVGVYGTAVAIDPANGETTAMGKRLPLQNQPVGIGVIGSELFAFRGRGWSVFELASGTTIRSLSANARVEAVGADAGDPGDFYSFSVNAGDTLTLATTTPGDGPFEFRNDLDPRIELFDPGGALVAGDDNGAPDGRNAQLTQTAAVSGTYTARVGGVDGLSPYLLTVQGHTGPLPPFAVLGVDPLDGAALVDTPTRVAVDLSDVPRLTTLEARDLTVDGRPALSVVMMDHDTAVFDLPTLGWGDHDLRIDAGSIEDLQNQPLAGFASRFTVLDQFESIAPLGSLIGRFEGGGTIVPNGGASVSHLDLTAGQTLTVIVEPATALVPRIEVHDPAGDPIVSRTATGSGAILAVQTLPIGSTGTYQVIVDGRAGTTGDYDVTVLLNALMEDEPPTASRNDVPASAESIEASFIDLGVGSAQRGAVLGALLPMSEATSVYFDDFESGALGPQWSTFVEGPPGFVGVTDDFDTAGHGLALATLLTADHSNQILKEAVLTVDLDGAEHAWVSFDQFASVQTNQGFAGSFLNHARADGLAISDDGVLWHHAWRPPPQRVADGWVHYVIDVGSVARSVGMDLSGVVHLKFQNDSRRTSSGNPDSRVWDNIRVETLKTDDAYQFELNAGQFASLVVTSLNGSAVRLELQDSLATPVALTTTDSSERSAVVREFVAPSDGTYFARVTGDVGAAYSLVVTRDAAFDVEPNDWAGDDVPDITLAGAALGHARVGGLDRLFVYDQQPDEIVELDPITGAALNRLASPLSNRIRGMASRPGELFVGGDQFDNIRVIDPDSGELIRTLPNPGFTIGGMAYAGGELFVTDLSADRFAALEPGDGAVLRMLPLDPAVAMGSLAAAGTRLLTMGNRDIYAIDVHSGDAVRLGTIDTSGGLGVIGDELFVRSRRINVYELPSLSFKRELSDYFFAGISADGPERDVYSFLVNAGDDLTIQTLTPGAGAGGLNNVLDPRIELFDPTGALIVADDNSATDGSNALITHTAGASGRYSVRVSAASGSVGEYVVFVTGHTGTLEPFPTPLDAVSPAGALIHRGQIADTIRHVNQTLIYSIELDAGQSVSLVGVPEADLELSLTLSDLSGAVLASATDPSRGTDAVLQAVAVGVAGAYRLDVTDTGTAMGEFELLLVLNGIVEHEGHDGPANDDPLSAQDLDGAMTTVPGTSVQVAAVMGSSHSNAAASEDFEGLRLGPEWTTWSSRQAGEIHIVGQLTGGGAGGTAHGLLMRVDFGSGPDVLNEAIWRVDLSHVTSPLLRFWHFESGRLEEETPFAGSFVDHYFADGIAISDDGLNWHPIWDAPSQSLFLWERHVIDLVGAAAAAGVDLGPAVQIKFQHIADNGSSSRAWDEIAVVEDGAPDHFTFSLSAGETVTLLATGLGGDQAPVMELMDSRGTPQAVTRPQAFTLGQLIADFAAPVADEYVVRVTSDFDYSLAVSRGATIQAEPPVPEALQDITHTGAVLGQLRAADAKRLFVYNYDLHQTVELDPVSGIALRSFDLPNFLLRRTHFGVAMTPDSLLFASNQDEPIYEVSMDTGATIRTIPNPDIRVSGLAFMDGEIYLLSDPRGDITVLDYESGKVARVIQAAPARIEGGLTAVAGRLLATGPGVLQEVDPITGTTTAIGALTESFSVQGLGVADDRLFVADDMHLDVYDLATLAFIRRVDLNDHITAVGGHVSGPVVDAYQFAANAGDALLIATSTPGGGRFEFVNDLDPLIDLIDPSGAVVATDDNGAADGRNASIRHTAQRGGNYTVRVRAAGGVSFGHYVLTIGGHTATAPLAVARTDPPDGARFQNAPPTMTIDFNDGLRMATLDPADITIAGSAVTGLTVVDDNTVVVDVPDLPAGTHTVAIAAGAVLDLQDTPIEPFASSLIIDRTGPRVIASSILEGDLVSTGKLVYTARFDEPLATDFDDSAFTLRDSSSQRIAPSRFDYDETTSTLTIEYADFREGPYSLTLESGTSRLRDTAGNPLDGDRHPITTVPSGDGIAGRVFHIRFTNEFDVVPFPMPLVPLVPPGSLIYSGSLFGFIDQADVDRFTIVLGEQQSIAVFVDALSNFKPAVDLIDPNHVVVATSTAVAFRGSVYLPPVVSQDPGTYTVVVRQGGASWGFYDIDLHLNVALAPELVGGPTNDDPASAVDLDPIFLTVGSGTVRRSAVLGDLPSSSVDDWYRFSLEDGQSASIALTRPGPGLSGLELYDAQSNLLASGVPADNVNDIILDHVDATLNGGPDSYFVHVMGRTSKYSLLVTVDGTFEAEPNDAQSQDISIAGAVMGAVGPGGPLSADAADQFAVTVAAGDDLIATLFMQRGGPLAFTNNLDPLIELIDTQGAVVATARHDGARIEHTSIAGGAYTIRVSALGQTAGEYVLEARTGPGIIPPRVTQLLARGSQWGTMFLDGLASAGLGSGGYSMGNGTDAAGPLPWPDIDELVLRFSEPVNLSAHHLTVVGLMGPDGVDDGIEFYAVDSLNTRTMPSGAYEAVLRFAEPLGADKLLFGLDAGPASGLADVHGNALASGDYVAAIHVLPGDADRDGYVVARDVIETRHRMGSFAPAGNYSAYHDFNADGFIVSADVLGIRSRLGDFLPFADPALPAAPSPTASAAPSPATSSVDVLGDQGAVMSSTDAAQGAGVEDATTHPSEDSLPARTQPIPRPRRVSRGAAGRSGQTLAALWEVGRRRAQRVADQPLVPIHRLQPVPVRFSSQPPPTIRRPGDFLNLSGDGRDSSRSDALLNKADDGMVDVIQPFRNET